MKFFGRPFAAALVIALFVACTPVPLPAQRAAVEAPHGLVVSANHLASDAGVEILRKGGNAVDAAVATGLALAVVYPYAGNLGGGGFMLIHLAPGGPGSGPDGRDLVIDYRETAPAAATKNMYVGPDGKLIAGAGSSTVGWRASGIPGSVAGFALALQKYGSGKVTWADVVEPARRLAADGHTVSQWTAASIRRFAPLLAPFAESKKIFLKDGAFLATGDHWVQPDLAATLARLQQHGPREFYEGETARRIAAAMAQHGGTLTLGDLEHYRVAERTPLRGAYRGYEIVTMPPPSSGGIALLQMFGMLEPFEVGALGSTSAAKYHLFAEVMKRAFRDRAEYLGDPAFVQVPVARLLDPAYLKRRMADYSPEHATPASAVPPGLGQFVAPAAPESTETTHFSVVDAAGNAVANTYTLNGAYGSGVTIPGTGILMNNEMDDFTSRVGVPNSYGLIQGEANAIVPGKRPLSSMTPTFVLKDHHVVLVTGSPGGPTIINTVLQVISNVIDFRMPVQQAVDAPRINQQWMPDVITYERYGLSDDTVAALRARGQALRERSDDDGTTQGEAETIAIDPKTGLRLGAPDPRRMDAKAAGY
ncbi:MAG: gamma-glutamyltransferase [Opitutae bacterium]|nr:gamma-glutamyltransferase [Opitutae bacterium]